jgi:hypothetical protein
MKRTLLASCILLSGCYVDPNTGAVYSVPQYPQQQIAVYHYQVPPPNPYYQARQQEWRQPEPYYQARQDQPYYQRQEWRHSAEEQYNQCVARDQERRMYQQPLEDCGGYFR